MVVLPAIAGLGKAHPCPALRCRTTFSSRPLARQWNDSQKAVRRIRKESAHVPRAAGNGPPLLPETSEDPELIESAIPADAEVVPLDMLMLPEASNLFKGLKVFIAGGSGQTGRLIVQRLVTDGVPVRALVRDRFAAAAVLPKAGVELIPGDVYQYATLPGAVGDSNVMIIVTGYRGSRLDPFGPYNVDYQGTVNLVTLAKDSGIEKIVLVTSIGVDDPFFPLNIFGGVLFWKKRAEEAVQRSGIDYTIIRPGGLVNELREGQPPGGLVFGGPDTYGLPPRILPGSVLRKQVAEVVVDALVSPGAVNKVVEVIAQSGQPNRSISELFDSIVLPPVVRKK